MKESEGWGSLEAASSVVEGRGSGNGEAVSVSVGGGNGDSVYQGGGLITVLLAANLCTRCLSVLIHKIHKQVEMNLT